VGRILSFLAITWALAGGFILLQEGLPALLDVMVGKGWIPDALVMPRSRGATTDCRAAIERARSSTPDRQVAARARVLVWRIGFQTGFAAGLASATAGTGKPVDAASLLARPQQLSAIMGIDPPALPSIQHAANALHEFQVFVAEDPGCVAAQIDEKYAARQAALYKFALVAGHAAVYRIKAPALGPIFVPELRVYGKQAEIPPELWKPLADESLESLPGTDAQQKISFILNRLDEHLKANP
jgi:hypothetical protein